MNYENWKTFLKLLGNVCRHLGETVYSEKEFVENQINLVKLTILGDNIRYKINCEYIYGETFVEESIYIVENDKKKEFDRKEELLAHLLSIYAKNKYGK